MNRKLFLFGLIASATTLGTVLILIPRESEVSSVATIASPEIVTEKNLSQEKIEAVAPSPKEISRKTVLPQSSSTASTPPQHSLSATASSNKPQGEAQQSTPKKYRDLKVFNEIRKSKLIEQAITEVDEDGIYTKLSVHQTDMDFPMVLLQEDILMTEAGEEVVHANAMVANHILLHLQPNIDLSELNQVLLQYSADIQSTEIEGLYRVEFEGKDPAQLFEIKDALASVSGVRASEPNYLISFD
jgi:hypothetical protein